MQTDKTSNNLKFKNSQLGNTSAKYLLQLTDPTGCTGNRFTVTTVGAKTT